MSSADGASDQNMDSILASIRRIIADDGDTESAPTDTGASRGDRASASQDLAPPPLVATRTDPSIVERPATAAPAVGSGFAFPPQQFPSEPEGLRPVPSDVVGADYGVSGSRARQDVSAAVEIPAGSQTVAPQAWPAPTHPAQSEMVSDVASADVASDEPEPLELGDSLTSLSALAPETGVPGAAAAADVERLPEPLPSWGPIDVPRLEPVSDVAAVEVQELKTAEAVDLSEPDVDQAVTPDEPFDLGQALSAVVPETASPAAPAVVADELHAAAASVADVSGSAAVADLDPDVDAIDLDALTASSVAEDPSLEPELASSDPAFADEALVAPNELDDVDAVVAAVAGAGLAGARSDDDSDDDVAEDPSGPVEAADPVEADILAAIPEVAAAPSAEPVYPSADASVAEAQDLAPQAHDVVAVNAAPDGHGNTDIAVGATSGRSLEDTVATMLRPMLRDWLDENMPRLVHKALQDGPPLIGGTAQSVDTEPADAGEANSPVTGTSNTEGVPGSKDG